MVNESTEKVSEQGFGRTLAPASDSRPVAYSDGIWDVIAYALVPHLKAIFGAEGQVKQSEVNEALATVALKAQTLGKDAYAASGDAKSASERACRALEAYSAAAKELGTDGQITTDALIAQVAKAQGDVDVIDNYHSQVENANVNLTNTNNEAIVAYINIIVNTLIEVINNVCFNNTTGMKIAESLKTSLALANLKGMTNTTKTTDVVGQWSFPIQLA